jgi:Matrixin
VRRADWLATAFVGVLVAGVGSMIATAPRRPAKVVPAPLPDTEAAPVVSTAKPTDSASTESLSVPIGGEVKVKLVRSANAAPSRDVEEIRRHIRLGAPGTYIDDILAEQDSQLVRWPDATMFRVWIAPTTDATEWLPEYADTVRSAFTAWTAAGAPINATFTTDSAAANVRIHWIDRFTEPGTIGQTQQTWDQYRWLAAGDITIAMHATTGQTLGAGWVRATALHEIGHLFGLNHSSTSGDIMASEAHSQELSRADLATLRLLYALPPGTVR